MLKFDDIHRFTSFPTHRANQSWDQLETQIARWTEYPGLDLDPDFQREHVWTTEQQIAYVEFIMRGGQTGKEIYFNDYGQEKPLVIVDGKQRLHAVRLFLANQVPAFGHLLNEYEPRLPWGYEFFFCVNNLKTRNEVLRWYLEMNSGGVVHTPEELDKVRRLLTEGA